MKTDPIRTIQNDILAIDDAVKVLNKQRGQLLIKHDSFVRKCPHNSGYFLVSVFWEDKKHSAWSADWDGQGEDKVGFPRIRPRSSRYGYSTEVRVRCGRCGKILGNKPLSDIPDHKAYEDWIVEATGMGFDDIDLGTLPESCLWLEGFN